MASAACRPPFSRTPTLSIGYGSIRAAVAGLLLPRPSNPATLSIDAPRCEDTPAPDQGPGPPASGCRRSGLIASEPFGAGPPATVAAAVEHLGYVQIDTINVIERCHHHILFIAHPGLSPRGPAAGPEHRQERVRILDACAGLCADGGLRFFIADDARAQARGPPLVRIGQTGDLRKVLRLIKRDGALTIRDIEDDVLLGQGAPVGQPQALQARAAARLLRRRADDQRAQRHAEDL